MSYQRKQKELRRQKRKEKRAKPSANKPRGRAFIREQERQYYVLRDKELIASCINCGSREIDGCRNRCPGCGEEGFAMTCTGCGFTPSDTHSAKTITDAVNHWNRICGSNLVVEAETIQ